jgi:predicted metal-dependent hydrolase
VVLNVPSRGSISEAKKFLASRIDWIREKTAGMPLQVELSEFFERKPLVFLDHHPRNIILYFSESRKKIIHQITADLIEVTLPANANKESSILSFMLQLARIYLPSRLERCAQQVGITYKKVRIGNQKSRWGSCSCQRVISLNWRILLLDYAIGEYVLYHELAHLKHMNHSSKYWKLLEEWVPGAKVVDRELSSAGRELMLLARA